MNQEFQKWHQLKSMLENISKKKVFFHEREIWFLYLGKNLGSEQDGKKQFRRPVVILKKFNQNLFWGIPLSMQGKNGEYYLEVLDTKNVKRTVILSQLRLLDKKRLLDKIGTVNKEHFKILKEKIIKFISES